MIESCCEAQGLSATLRLCPSAVDDLQGKIEDQVEKAAAGTNRVRIEAIKRAAENAPPMFRHLYS